MFCTSCGSNVGDAKFCTVCGAALKAAVPQPAVPQPAVPQPVAPQASTQAIADNIIDYKIIGSEMQLVEIELDPGEGVRAEAGAMTYMTQGIEMETSASGGIMGGLKRALTGESFFITSFTNKGRGKQQVSFAAPYPGKIIPLDLKELGGTFLCQKDAYLCSAVGINVDVAFTKRLGAGLFGGEGFILQKLVGSGLAFIHAGGTIIEKRLAPGETLRVDTGCLVAFAPSVDYDIAMVKGFKNMLFGGEGLFLATLTGPGLVYLQSLPLSRMADRIISSTKAGRGKDEQSGLGSIAGVGGSILGSFFGD